MSNIIKKIVIILLLAIIFISNAFEISKAVYEISEAHIEKIGQADYHLKYYKEDRGIYTNVICSIVGYHKDGKFYPAYCLNKDLYGAEKESYSVDVDSLIDNNQVWRAVKNGYPYKTAEEMGLSSDFDAFAVTKFAIYCLRGESNLDYFSADEEDEEGQAMLNALHHLVDIGLNGTENYNDELKISQKGDLTEDGKYYSLVYEVKAGNTIQNYNIKSISGITEGDLITDLEGNIKTAFNSGENFKIKIPKDKLVPTKEFNIKIEATLNSYPLYYGKTRVAGTQNYLLTASTYQNIEAEINTKLELNTGKIVINKIDEDTKEAIEGVEFELYNAKDEILGTYKTDENGKIEISNLFSGQYKLKETKTNDNYILDEDNEFTIEVNYNKTTEKTIENKKIKGKVKIIKTSSENSEITGIKKGDALKDIKFEIYDKNKKLVDTIQTDEDGVAISKDLEKGKYKIKEVETNKWYLLDENQKNVEITHNNQIITLNLENTPAKPDEDVIKKGPDKATANEEIAYQIYVENTGNVPLDNFIWEDEIPTEYIRVNKIQLGTYNQEKNYNIYYKTNFSNEYKLLLEGVSTKTFEEIDLSKEIASNEYITNLKLDFGTVDVGFKTENESIIKAKVNSNVKRDDIFENKVVLTSNYKGYNLTKPSSWKTIIYEILPLTGM